MLDNLKNLFIKNLRKGKVLDLHEILFQEQIEDSLIKELFGKWYKTITTLSYLSDIPKDINEIIVHSPTDITYITNRNKIYFDSDIMSEDIQISLEYFAFLNNIKWNEAEPFVSFFSNFIDKKVRVTLTHNTLSPENKPKLFIRFLNEKAYTLRHFNIENTQFFHDMISKKKNILISGATGSGKTTFANSLTKLINENEHIIMIEDTFELISPNNTTTRLLSEIGVPNKTMEKYMANAMRMSPDRIILGEIRSEEVCPTLLALNTGHNGFISTIHANSALDAIQRFCLLFKLYSNKEIDYSLILELLCKNIDYVVYMNSKNVTEIIKIIGSENGHIFHEKITDFCA